MKGNGVLSTTAIPDLPSIRGPTLSSQREDSLGSARFETSDGLASLPLNFGVNERRGWVESVLGPLLKVGVVETC